MFVSCGTPFAFVSQRMKTNIPTIVSGHLKVAGIACQFIVNGNNYQTKCWEKVQKTIKVKPSLIGTCL